VRPPQNWKCAILDTLLFAGVENTDSWCTRKGGFAACFPLDVSIVHLLKSVVIIDGSNLIGIELTWGETIRFGNQEFIADRFDNLSLSPEGNDSGAVFVGIAHSGSLSLHAILEEFTNKNDSTPVIPVTTTPLREGTSVRLTIPTVP
jgi:hypothetical protein